MEIEGEGQKGRQTLLHSFGFGSCAMGSEGKKHVIYSRVITNFLLQIVTLFFLPPLSFTPF